MLDGAPYVGAVVETFRVTGCPLERHPAGGRPSADRPGPAPDEAGYLGRPDEVSAAQLPLISRTERRCGDRQDPLSWWHRGLPASVPCHPRVNRRRVELDRCCDLGPGPTRGDRQRGPPVRGPARHSSLRAGHRSPTDPVHSLQRPRQLRRQSGQITCHPLMVSPAATRSHSIRVTDTLDRTPRPMGDRSTRHQPGDPTGCVSDVIRFRPSRALGGARPANTLMSGRVASLTTLVHIRIRRETFASGAR